MPETNEIQAIADDKESYSAPKLRALGSVSELTLTNSPPPFSGSDGGSFPNMYAS